MPHRTKLSLRVRRLTSLIIAVAFLVMLSSGVLCFLAPKGRVANEIDWQFLGLVREQWIALHLTSSALFLAAALLHVFYNWKGLLKFIRSRPTEERRFSLEAFIALMLGIVLVVGTLREWPGLHDLVTWRSSIKHGVEAVDGEQSEEEEHRSRGNQGGGQGFGQMTLEELCAQEDVDLTGALDRLAAEGIVATGDTNLRDLADWMGVHPRDVVGVLFPE